MKISPFSNFRLMPQRQFSEMFRDSSCAKDERIVSSSSPDPSRVLIPSFSKITAIPQSRSSLTYCRQSRVFRANRETDFVMITSIFPARASLNSSEFIWCELFLIKRNLSGLVYCYFTMVVPELRIDNISRSKAINKQAKRKIDYKNRR